LRDEYEKIKRSGDKYVYYLPSKDLIGNDGESTVDGIHLTDVGFVRFAKKLNRKIQTIIKCI
ncbi:MAG: GDSL-like Lipase/Acylhydrolase family, partial [Bacteroidetes bacterium]|nr:GDSL-like Lipase/Acylhydrolase family [Bacteroidota bacterium]